MGKSLYSYNTGYYFGAGVRVFGWITTALSIMMIAGDSVAAYVLLPAGFITQFTHYRTEFDLANRTYREGTRFAGITFGKMLQLPPIDFLFLKHNRYRQTVESRASMSTFQSEKYDGYLKFSDNVKLHLVQSRDKRKALQQLARIAQDLQAELRDLSEVKL